MTKSTITREQQRQILIDTAQHIISRESTSPHSENLRELARMALAFIEMRDQMIEIAKCFLVIDDIRKIIRILNDKAWSDTNGFRCIQTDVGKELESVIDGLIDQIKPSLSPRPDEIKKYIRETLIEKGL
nr:MAG TPA: DCN1-like protein 4, Cullin-1 Ligase, Ligase - protein.55A [Caudoviricetes sp.]